MKPSPETRVNAFSAAQVVITAIIAPALLILASASLIATALVRLARVVDRIRKLGEATSAPWMLEELPRHRRRAHLAERAIAYFFLAIACFVVAGFTIALDRASGERFAWLPVAIVSLGMALIVGGCAAMISETRLSLVQIDVEIARMIS